MKQINPPYWGLQIVLYHNKDEYLLRNKKTGRFEKGFTWREEKPYWKKSFLINEYLKKKKPAKQIAIEQNCKTNNILYFLNKFKIKTRTMSDVRKIKHWGQRGKNNPMFGKLGKENPNWNGGHSGERQCLYARSFWKEIKQLVLKRDNYLCQICFSEKKLIVHHVLPWSKYPSFRFTESNLTTLCVSCHKKIHAKRR